jgi:hypothetical protein
VRQRAGEIFVVVAVKEGFVLEPRHEVPEYPEAAATYPAPYRTNAMSATFFAGGAERPGE